jgi:hypothetical protein
MASWPGSIYNPVVPTSNSPRSGTTDPAVIVASIEAEVVAIETGLVGTLSSLASTQTTVAFIVNELGLRSTQESFPGSFPTINPSTFTVLAHVTLSPGRWKLEAPALLTDGPYNTDIFLVPDATYTDPTTALVSTTCSEGSVQDSVSGFLSRSVLVTGSPQWDLVVWTANTGASVLTSPQALTDASLTGVNTTGISAYPLLG